MRRLASLVPAQVGVAARLSADCLAAFVCDVIDEGFSIRRVHCGLVVDLKKCFNMIPRRPMAVFMEKLQIPREYIRAQQSMLQQLARYIEIWGQTGQPIGSCCGFPEGCAFSVVIWLLSRYWQPIRYAKMKPYRSLCTPTTGVLSVMPWKNCVWLFRDWSNWFNTWAFVSPTTNHGFGVPLQRCGSRWLQCDCVEIRCL